MEIDIKDYDITLLGRLESSPPLIETDNLATIASICNYSFQNSTSSLIVSNPGYGVSTAIQYVKKNIGKNVLQCDLTHQGLKEGIISIFKKMGLDYDIVKWDKVKIQDLINAFLYQLSISKTERKLLIIYGTPLNTNNYYSDLLLLYNGISKLNNCGCVIALREDIFSKLLKLSNKDFNYKILFDSIDDIVELSRPSNIDMRSICQEAGILSPEITQILIENSDNLIVLFKRLNKIKYQISNLV